MPRPGCFPEGRAEGHPLGGDFRYEREAQPQDTLIDFAAVLLGLSLSTFAYGLECPQAYISSHFDARTRNFDPLDTFPWGILKEHSMRVLIFAVMFAATAQGAWAQKSTIKTDPMAVPNAESSAESELLMGLQEITKKLEEAGFKEIQIVSPTLLVQAKDKFDKPVLMIVNPETMVALQIQAPSESETTGSGSPDENRFRRQDQR